MCTISFVFHFFCLKQSKRMQNLQLNKTSTKAIYLVLCIIIEGGCEVAEGEVRCHKYKWQLSLLIEAIDFSTLKGFYAFFFICKKNKKPTDILCNKLLNCILYVLMGRGIKE